MAMHLGRYGERMKVVILVGGKGTRIGEESQFRPKPMVEVGGRPILWHIMKWYSGFGFHEFILCCGYKGHMIKQYFVNYYSRFSDVSINLHSGEKEVLTSKIEPWKVTLINTGLNTLTAGRILKIREYVKGEEFLFTYGDGVSDVNIRELIECHRRHGRTATITVTKPDGRFGAVKIDEPSECILNFKEKARSDQSWVNAGFGVFTPDIFDYLGDGTDMLEGRPFELLAEKQEMTAYRHQGFWSPMDTLRDKEYLEKLWYSGKAPWKA